MQVFPWLQYAEKFFVRQIKDKQYIHFVKEQLWKGVHHNDNKAVYRYIVSSDIDVNSIGEEVLKVYTINTHVNKSAKAGEHCYWFNCIVGNSEEKTSSSDCNSLYKSRDISEGCSLLHVACQNADIGTVELLLQYGANINISDSKGRTPLHYCIIGKKSATARMLLMRCLFDSALLEPNTILLFFFH